MLAFVVLATLCAVIDAQNVNLQATIGTGGQSTMVATAHDLELRELDGTLIASLRGVLSSIAMTNATASAAVSTLSAQLTAQISTVTSTAQQSIEDGDMNTAAIGTINSLMASQLPFTGPAASMSSLQSAMLSMADRMSRTEAALSRLESHNLATCQDLCTGGTCVNSTQGSGSGASSIWECQCDSGRFGTFCQQSYAPTPAPTDMPTEAPTLAPISSCSQATTSGTYAFTGGFDAYCLVRSGEPNWMRILYWGDSYSVTTSAVNAGQCALANPTSHCKLSDTQINSVISGTAGRYYWLNSSQITESLYIWTTDAYVDNAMQFGINTRTCRAAVRANWIAGNPGTAFRNNYLDFLSPADSSYNRQETCERLFMGINTIDCWPGQTGSRCIHGGATCTLGRYANLGGWNMWIASA